jgi:hypothetical protein
MSVPTRQIAIAETMGSEKSDWRTSRRPAAGGERSSPRQIGCFTNSRSEPYIHHRQRNAPSEDNRDWNVLPKTLPISLGPPLIPQEIAPQCC